MDTSAAQKPNPITQAVPGSDPARIDSRRRFKLLEECREMVLEKLSGVISKALEKMAEELTADALKATRSDRQRALLDAVMLVREQRSSLEQSFRRYFGDVFERRLFASPERDAAQKADAARVADLSSDEMSLVSDEAIADRIDVDRLIQRARSRLDPNEVLGIRARLGALLERDWFDEGSHPASPEAVYEALRIAVHELAPTADVRNALLAAFEPHVTKNLNSIYSSLNTQLVANQILPKIRPRVGRGQTASGPSATGSSPRELPAQAPAGVPPGGFASSSAMMELGHPGSMTMSGAGMAALQQALMRAALGTPEGRGDAARMLSDPGMFGMADLPVDPVRTPLVESLTQMQRSVGADPRYAARPPEGRADDANDAAAGVDAIDPAFVAHGGDWSNDGSAAGARMVMELLPLLIEKVKENGTPLDQMTVELVSVVFDYIYADKSLAEPVKHQLLRLQVVAVKAALLDRSFFARRQHPMRQLIDRITQLAADPDADLAVGAPLVAGLTRVIDQLIAEFASDLTAFLVAIDRIDELSQQEATRRSVQIATQLKAAEREEAYSLALEDARNEIAIRIDQETPTFIREFLLRWWTPVIARARVEVRFAPTGEACEPAPAAPGPESAEQKALRIAEFLDLERDAEAPRGNRAAGRLAAEADPRADRGCAGRRGASGGAQHLHAGTAGGACADHRGGQEMAERPAGSASGDDPVALGRVDPLRARPSRPGRRGRDDLGRRDRLVGIRSRGPDRGHRRCGSLVDLQARLDQPGAQALHPVPLPEGNADLQRDRSRGAGRLRQGPPRRGDRRGGQGDRRIDARGRLHSPNPLT